MSGKIEIASGDGNARIVTASTRETVGLWVTNAVGCVGLVAEPGLAPYLVLYRAGEDVPALALYAGEHAGATVQVPGPHGLVDARVVSLGKILDLIK